MQALIVVQAVCCRVGICLIAFLDDIYVVCSSVRFSDVCASLQRALRCSTIEVAVCL